MLKHALKEWAVICRALATGRQALILRKGGLAEAGGEFEVKHRRFWLFPAYLHQHRAGLKPEGIPLLEAAEAEKSPAGMVRLTHFAEVAGVYDVRDQTTALTLAPLHLWSEETVQSRFSHRRPGLLVMPLRVYSAAETFELADTVDYAGCKSWVELERELPTEGATPVMTEETFGNVLHTLDTLLQPTAFV
jgi:hypothetical protein